MAVLRSERRPGSYFDSIVLMQLQATLAQLPGVVDAGVVMASPENRALLAASGLLPEGSDDLGPEDLLVSVLAEDEAAAASALAEVGPLLAPRRAQEEGEYQPRTLASALRQRPEARWALVSVPGRFAAGVAREALKLGLNVLIYSDNVPLSEEVALKTEARSRGLLVLGPDCGTAILGGVGFGFANRVRRGRIGLVGASGTGLQAVTSRIHELGGGISHAIGTGGRDLQAEVGGIAALQGLKLLERSPETDVIVLVSKKPDAAVASMLLGAARRAGKPVVVHFLGAGEPPRRDGPVTFVGTLTEAAAVAVGLAGSRAADAAPESAGIPMRDRVRGIRARTEGDVESTRPAAAPRASTTVLPPRGRAAAGRKESSNARAGRDRRIAGPPYLRGLFAGGSLAYEALQEARSHLSELRSNLDVDGAGPMLDPTLSRGHVILDLGADELTQGRLHPMMDQTLRLRRIRQEATDSGTGVILLDVVLGDGAHRDPAGELAPVIEAVRRERDVDFVSVVVGTDEDPQDLADQADRLRAAGARVFRDTVEAVRYAAERLGSTEEAVRYAAERSGSTEESAGDVATRNAGGVADVESAIPDAPGTASETAGDTASPADFPDVPLHALSAPGPVINVGVEAFYESLLDQGADAVHVDWRPPAGGNERLMALLERMKG